MADGGRDESPERLPLKPLSKMQVAAAAVPEEEEEETAAAAVSMTTQGYGGGGRDVGALKVGVSYRRAISGSVGNHGSGKRYSK